MQVICGGNGIEFNPVENQCARCCDHVDAEIAAGIPPRKPDRSRKNIDLDVFLLYPRLAQAALEVFRPVSEFERQFRRQQPQGNRRVAVIAGNAHRQRKISDMMFPEIKDKRLSLPPFQQRKF